MDVGEHQPMMATEQPVIGPLWKICLRDSIVAQTTACKTCYRRVNVFAGSERRVLK